MSEKLSTAGKMVVLFSVAIILFAGMSSLAGADETPTQEDLGDIQVNIDTTDRPIISIDKGERSLYTVEYLSLQVNTSDGYDDYFEDLGQINWSEPEIEDNSDARFPHLNIALSAELNDVDGTLKLNLNVISYKDTHELTFSYVLEDIGDLPGGNIFFTQDVVTSGTMIKPEDVDSSDNLNSYRFEFRSGEKGYYSWKSETSFNGESSKSDYITLKNGNRLYIISEFERDANSVSLSSLDMEETRTGANVPVPEPYDRVPSFVIGVAIGSGMAVGMLFKKRKDFYQKKDGWETVSLEESSYYRGEE